MRGPVGVSSRCDHAVPGSRPTDTLGINDGACISPEGSAFRKDGSCIRPFRSIQAIMSAIRVAVVEHLST